MKPKFLLICFFVPTLLVSLTSCKHSIDAQTAVCRLTSATNQLIETSGKLTDEMQRTFTYTSDGVATIAERSQKQDATFRTEYTDKRIARATNGQDAITLGYGSATTLPISATFSRGSSVRSTFVMDYTPTNQLSRITERRLVLFPNSLIVERTYTFSYDNAGNLLNERAKFIFQGGLALDQETEYSIDTKPSPYTHFPERSLLTVIALSQAVETLPGRFWHVNTPTAYKTYDLNASGNRGTLRESSTFAPTYDATNKLMTQDQTALLYQSSVPDPVTKRNRQAFVYQCD